MDVTRKANIHLELDLVREVIKKALNTSTAKGRQRKM